MANKTWNGSTGSFDDATRWTPTGVPTSGDTALIVAGTVTEAGALPSGLRIQVDPTTATSAALLLSNASIAAGAHVLVDASQSSATLRATGTVRNAGGITLVSNTSLLLEDGTGGAASQFINTGGISVSGQVASFVSNRANAASGIVNDGVVSVRAGATALTGAPFSGTGTVRLAAGGNLQLGGAIGTGQNILFEAGAASSQLQVGNAAEFKSVISGFGAADQITMSSTHWDASSYAVSGGVGTFTFTLAGATVATVSFAGSYNLSNLNVSTTYIASIDSQQTTFTTTVADQPARVAFTDTSNDVSGNEAATAYTGPVAGLQYEYIWSSPDDVAMGAQVPNMFLHGGSGNDAIVALSGSNVLDGGGGSNFLIGATGTDGGSDTFFVDGRGGTETWSTLANFHPGDSAVIFGFKQGVSTTPWTASDGAAGYTGATIHSELGGAGTGVNASITFANVNIATANDPSKFAISYNPADSGTDYIFIHYNA